tara:strand:+ start:372 stop:878 length:507 start_codon:yes stop_codon:yes gene_type:complete
MKQENWESLSPSRLVEVTLCCPGKMKTPQGAVCKTLDKVYRLSAYTITPGVGSLHTSLYRDRFFGILIRTYGLRHAESLNSSYEIIGKKPADYDTIFNLMENKINTLVRKKTKKGYKDVSSDISFHIPSLHRNRDGINVNAITESFITNDAAQVDFKNRNVGKFVNIL